MRFLRRMPHVYRFTVDYSKSTQQLIEVGRFEEWEIGTDLDDRVEGTDKAELEARLFDAKEAVSCDEASAEMDEAGFRPATLSELLAFGTKYPGRRDRHRVVAALRAFSSLTSENSHAIYLLNKNKKRTVERASRARCWSPGCKFLAVAK